MISFLFFFLLTYEKQSEHGCRPSGRPDHRTRRERNGGGVPQLGKAKLAAEMSAARAVCELARTVMTYTDERIDVHYFLILLLHGEVEEDGRRLCASLNGERLGLELVMVELRP